MAVRSPLADMCARSAERLSVVGEPVIYTRAEDGSVLPVRAMIRTVYKDTYDANDTMTGISDVGITAKIRLSVIGRARIDDTILQSDKKLWAVVKVAESESGFVLLFLNSGI